MRTQGRFLFFRVSWRLRANMEFVFRVNLDFRHRLMLVISGDASVEKDQRTGKFVERDFYSSRALRSN